MSGFSKEICRSQAERQDGRCAILGLQVDVLEGHHALMKRDGGSDDPKNCIMLAGYGAYCAYGVPVEDVHEKADLMGIRNRLYLHPETLTYVNRDELPKECFRNKDDTRYDEVVVRKKPRKQSNYKRHRNKRRR